MPRAMWSGVIGFGMVSIPIKLYAATENKNVSFHQIHNVCKTRIKEVRWCPSCDREIAWEEVEKGFEYSKGEYVALSSEELEKLPLPSKDIIDVSAFCNTDEIDPLYFEKHYYLEAEKAGQRPFNLFVKALLDKSMVGIASITLRTKERLCALRPVGSYLVLSTLLYPDELRISPSSEYTEPSVTKQELAMAENLIELLAEDFDPEKYTDRYREALLKMIDEKLEGQPVQREKVRKTQGEVVDLLEALQMSVNSAKSGATLKKQKGGNANSTKSTDEKIVQIAGPKTEKKTAASSAARKQKTGSIGTVAKTSAKSSSAKTDKTKAKSKAKSRRSA